MAEGTQELKQAKTKVIHITAVDMSLRYLLMNMMRAQQRQGFEVAGISTAGDNVSFIESNGVRHIPVTITRRFSPFADLMSLWNLYWVLRRERPTIVHTHTPKPGLIGQLAAKFAGVPIIVNTIHGFYFHDFMPTYWRRFYILMEQIAAKCSDLIFLLNEDNLQTIRQEHIASDATTYFLGSGIDLERFDPNRVDQEAVSKVRRELNIPKNALVVGFVARLVKIKGVPELLQAARIIREHIPELRIVLVGPIDSEKPDFVTPDMAREYGVDDICIFTGMRQDMPEIFAMMDMLTLPSYREGLAYATMEACAMGLPCVLTDIPGNREVIKNGTNGLFVLPGDVKGLAEAIIQMLTNEEMRARMGKASREIALEHFDQLRVFNRVIAEYNRLIQEKGIKPDASPI
jgi:glycosyltransferase involved in cell wall biosynthesis